MQICRYVESSLDLPASLACETVGRVGPQFWVSVRNVSLEIPRTIPAHQ